MCHSKINSAIFNYNHFSKVWKELSSDQKKKVIEIIGKGIIPYEKIKWINFLQITLEDGIFFSKDGFFSTLKKVR